MFGNLCCHTGQPKLVCDGFKCIAMNLWWCWKMSPRCSIPIFIRYVINGIHLKKQLKKELNTIIPFLIYYYLRVIMNCFTYDGNYVFQYSLVYGFFNISFYLICCCFYTIVFTVSYYLVFYFYIMYRFKFHLLSQNIDSVHFLYEILILIQIKEL